MPWRRVPQICVSSSWWHCPPLMWLAWPFGYRRSETQHFLDHCWLVSFKVCTLTGFHSAVVQELTPADCESLNRTWDSCGAPIHSQRLLRQGKDARSKFLALWEQMADLRGGAIFELCSRSLQVQTISSSQDRSLLVSCLWFVLASFCWVQKPVCLWSQARRKPGKAAAFAHFFSGCQLCMVERSLHPSTESARMKSVPLMTTPFKAFDWKILSSKCLARSWHCFRCTQRMSSASVLDNALKTWRLSSFSKHCPPRM